MRIAEFERAAVRELGRRIRTGSAIPHPRDALEFTITEICWDLACEVDLATLLEVALANQELMLTAPPTTQVVGDPTASAADVLRWRLYEHLVAVLARFVEPLAAA